MTNYELSDGNSFTFNALAVKHLKILRIFSQNIF